jgi:Vacuolar protein sorting-associated protein 62
MKLYVWGAIVALFVPAPVVTGTVLTPKSLLRSPAGSLTFYHRELSKASKELPAQVVTNKRAEINKIYNQDYDTSKYGGETRTILRYDHTDGQRRNLCPYHNSTMILPYKMGNYKISKRSGYIEVKSVGVAQMDFVYGGPMTTSYFINIKRPREEDGYYRLGDVAFGVDPLGPKGQLMEALIVKASGDILMPPVRYEQIWNDYAGFWGSRKLRGSTTWRPIPPDGYRCLGHVWSLGSAAPPTDLIRCIKAKFVETSGVGGIWTWNDGGSGASLDGSV